jgi:hypothetical protein
MTRLIHTLEKWMERRFHAKLADESASYNGAYYGQVLAQQELTIIDDVLKDLSWVTPEKLVIFEEALTVYLWHNKFGRDSEEFANILKLREEIRGMR